MDRTTDSIATATPTPPTAETLAATAALAASIPDTELIPIRLDITTSASGVMGQLETIELHRPLLVRIFGAEATETLDALLPAAHHVLISDARFNASGDRDLEPLADSLRQKRTRLFLAASTLDRRGFRVDVLRNLTGGQSYSALGRDALALVTWFEANSSALGASVKLTPTELAATHAEAIAFIASVGKKARAGTGAAAVDRARAYTHFVRTYDHARKLVTYARWHEGDADSIAPSLFAGRSRKAASPITSAPTTPVAPGMPGGSPFAPAT